MKLTINPTIIYRTPKFPLNACLEDHWEELKTAILLSSPVFYDIIKEFTSQDLNGLPKNIFFTIWKYFNRAKYRATPYGSFAGFGLFKTNENAEISDVRISNKQILHEFVDWPYKDQIDQDSYPLIHSNTNLLSNSTYYTSGNRLRYVAATDSGFELCEEIADDLTIQILSLCKRAFLVKDLISTLTTTGLRSTIIEEKIKLLTELQLLLTDRTPNIIGHDFFKRLKIHVPSEVTKYIIAEHPFESGNLDTRLFKHFPELLKILSRLSPVPENKTLQEFIQRFQKKFEQREIPLMVALDPEMGLGYNALEQSNDIDDFVMQFTGRAPEAKLPGQLTQFLSRKLLNDSKNTSATIALEDFPIQNENPFPYPNSLSAAVTIADDLVIVEHLGGCTANALLGRFTLVSEILLDHCQTIAALEAEANSGVFFFDIAYMSEGYVDNINRRESIYDYRLSILNYDTSASPLMLSDLTLTVHGGELILLSKSLGKRLIPRMASAYNYSRSDLPIFRLLCDLQYQGITAQPLLSLENLVKGLDFYPRLQYRNIMLSPAKWRIAKENVIKTKYDIDPLNDCRHYLLSIGIKQYFKTGKADQTLCFNIFEDTDLRAFLHYMSKEQTAMLQEVILPENTAIKDQAENPFCAELVLSLHHTQPVYNAINTPKINNGQTKAIVTVFPPAKEWLYFEIYCHPQRADQVIEQSIGGLVHNFKGDILQWFFIRYNENGEHVRLRFRLSPSANPYRLTNALNELLSEDIQSGVVADVQIKTYKREIDRYHPDMIERVEQHFHRDSIYVLSLINEVQDILQRYFLCLQIISAVKTADIFTVAELKHLLRTVSASFEKEHHLKTNDFKQLNIRYKEYQACKLPLLADGQNKALIAVRASLIAILQDCLPERRARLFSDLMHMHINRLFNSQQRTHEMVIYCFAIKDFEKNMRLKKVPTGS